MREGIIAGFEREDGIYDFAASSPVSLEQLTTILSRLGATSDEVAAAGDDLSEFLDGDKASPWSRSPIAWAAEKGLVGGYENEDGRARSRRARTSPAAAPPRSSCAPSTWVS